MIPRPSGIEISSKIISVQFHSSPSNQWVNSLRNRSLFCANYRGRSLFCRGADLEQQLIVFMRCYSTVSIRSRASAWLAFPVLGLFHYTWRATTMNVRGILFSPVEPTIPVMWHNSCHISLQWRHNGHDSVSNHQPHDCLLNHLFRRRSKKKHQSSASLAFVWGIHRGPVNSSHKWPVTRKMFPFDDAIMLDKGIAMVARIPHLNYNTDYTANPLEWNTTTLTSYNLAKTNLGRSPRVAKQPTKYATILSVCMGKIHCTSLPEVSVWVRAEMCSQ